MQPFGPRRALWIDLTNDTTAPLTAEELNAFEKVDAVYRTLCAMLYNYVPMSGHPGGSISSGRFVSSLLFETMDYDIADPEREDADVISYAAGHKALGLYSMWALRNELVRIANPAMLPDPENQLRFEDLLGFRRNPTNSTPLFGEFGSKALDGHPTPATPFVRLSTGASGVGMASSLGHALALADWFGDAAPRLHIVEGEGGLTPGRVAEALAFAGSASLKNAIVHLDWNQSSIDSDRVTREGANPGDYVQWDPVELFYLHDWNVIYVPDGFDFQRVITAQKRAVAIDNGQPTAIVYRTTKGWKYGIEGRASHGAGHKLCSKGFYDAIPFGEELVRDLPRCGEKTLCNGGENAAIVERCFWDALSAVRRFLERDPDLARAFANRIARSKQRLDAAERLPRPNAPSIDDLYSLAGIATLPRELELTPGTETTLRGQLGKALGFLNKFSGGSIFVAAADLLGSTSINEGAKEFAAGYYSYAKNRDSRTLAVGGICEDAMSGILSGLSAFGKHIGAGASYGAFIAPLGHIASRLHAIGAQARFERTGAPGRPMILICGHAGLKTGEDGPTHADPQPLQLLQENFPPGAMITLTPWEPTEIWPALAAALSRRPSVIAPFVTRPNEIVLDREALGLAPAGDAADGVYLLRKARGERDGVVVLQESAVTYAFVTEALPLLEKAGIEVDVYYVSSAELFDLLPLADRERIFPQEAAHQAIGITGFTLPTMYRWIQSDLGRAMTMHPYMHGQYPGSGQGWAVVAEAGLDGESQYHRIVDYLGLRVASTA
jgi:transketolase